MAAFAEVLTSRKDFFLQLTLEHLSISFISIAIAGCLGIIIGIIISEFNRSSTIVLSIINFIYTIPSISLLGFLIPLSGVGNTTAVIALTIYALLPIVRSTYTGIMSIDPAILEASKGMGSTEFQILYKIKLPMALAIIMSGFRNMVTMTIALAGIASFIGAGGLGVAIYRGITTNNAAMTMAGSILIALLALLADYALSIVERMVSRKSRSKKRNKALLLIPCGAVCIGFIFAVITGQSKGTAIKIATKPMTEQYILGEMLKELIEKDTDLNVALTQGVGGGTSNIQPGMERGDFDLYPEYTGTGWNMILGKDSIYNELMFDTLQKEYLERYNFEWLGMYGFNNTYGLAIRSEVAKEYDIQTYSDLSAYAKRLTFGAEYDFYEREDGYDSLCEAYSYDFNKTMDLDIGLKYQAINEGKIDVMNIFTTDGQLSTADVVVLTDDKDFYPSYRCGNVVRRDILQKYPELEAVFLKLNNCIDDEVMAKLNYQVDTEGLEPKEAAKRFLLEKGL